VVILRNEQPMVSAAQARPSMLCNYHSPAALPAVAASSTAPRTKRKVAPLPSPSPVKSEQDEEDGLDGTVATGGAGRAVTKVCIMLASARH